MKKLSHSHTTGKPFPIDDAMIDLRNRLLPVFGYVIRPCTIGPCLKPPKPIDSLTRLCIEREAIDSEMNGVMMSGYHCVPGPERATWEKEDSVYYNWPDEVMKAAHAIDKSKPAKVSKAGAGK